MITDGVAGYGPVEPKAIIDICPVLSLGAHMICTVSLTFAILTKKFNDAINSPPLECLGTVKKLLLLAIFVLPFLTHTPTVCSFEVWLL